MSDLWPGTSVDAPPEAVRRSPFPPGSVKYNSQGEPYSPELDHLPPDQAAGVRKSMDAIKKFRGTWAGPPAVQDGVALDPPGRGSSSSLSVDAAAPPPKGASERPATGGGSRAAVVKFWMDNGAPQHVAEGIADRVGGESYYRSDAWNPDDSG